MKSTLCTWEDETSNRQIQFSVDYSIENGAIAVQSVTPQKVSFVCARSNTVERSIGIHTDTGRRHLANKFQASEGFSKLSTAIANPNGDMLTPHISIRMEVSTI